MAYVRRALLDENVQYLLLALYWMAGENEDENAFTRRRRLSPPSN